MRSFQFVIWSTKLLNQAVGISRTKAPPLNGHCPITLWLSATLVELSPGPSHHHWNRGKVIYFLWKGRESARKTQHCLQQPRVHREQTGRFLSIRLCSGSIRLCWLNVSSRQCVAVICVVSLWFRMLTSARVGCLSLSMFLFQLYFLRPLAPSHFILAQAEHNFYRTL